MGKTFPHPEALRIDRAGYYFNERLCKLEIGRASCRERV